MQSCTIAQPVDAAGYISNYIAPYLKAQVKSANTIEALQQQMDESAMQMTNTARQAGNNAYSHRGSAAEGLLAFNDGKEGLGFLYGNANNCYHARHSRWYGIQLLQLCIVADSVKI